MASGETPRTHALLCPEARAVMKVSAQDVSSAAVNRKRTLVCQYSIVIVLCSFPLRKLFSCCYLLSNSALISIVSPASTTTLYSRSL